MTNTELLFREIQRDTAIPFEEFKEAGWSLDDFLTYTGICEQMRAFYICKNAVLHVPGVREDFEIKFRKRELYAITSSLSNFLSKHIKTQIKLDIQLNEFNDSIYAHYCTYAYKRSELYTCKILASSEAFRFKIEQKISACIIGNKNTPLSRYRAINSIMQVSEASSNGQNNVNSFAAPDIPKPIYSYSKLQEWAEDYDEYCQEKIYKRNIPSSSETDDPIFISQTNYIYICPQVPKCMSKHSVKNIVIFIPGIFGRDIRLNVHYCKDCDVFFLSQQEYKNYINQYKFIPARFRKLILDHGYIDINNCEPVSPLYFCGYNVAEKNDITKQQRQLLLKALIDRKIFSQEYIADLIKSFIEKGEERGNFYEACEKWKDDMYFVLNYMGKNITKQDKQYF